MTVARLLEGRRLDIISCNTAMPVREAVNLLASKRIGAVPVLEEGRVIGIFSERDVIYQLAEGGPKVLDQTVGAVMTSPVISVSPETPILEALGVMTRRRVRHLPVVRDDRIVGFLSIGDLVKWRMDQTQAEAEAMRAYIQSA